MIIAIGMIVRDLLSAHPLTDFLDNAEKYGHALDRMIVVYSHQADSKAVEELRSRTNLSLIKLQSNERAHLIMKEIGVRHSSIHQLLYCPLIDAHGLIPYGFNRNQALMEAMFTGTDYLIFVDSDVRPEVLRKTPDGAVQSEEIDFIGAHLHGLSLGADVTSSDYSGYILSHVWRCGNQPYIFDSSSDIDSSLPCAILCTERTLQLGSSEECPCIADRAGRTGNINILTKNNGSQKIFRSYSECIS